MIDYTCLIKVGVVALCFSVSCTSDDASAGAPGTSSATGDVAPTPAASLPARNPALAPHGEELFTTRACISCHTVGAGRLVGPDLKGVTERRSRAWILAMILNPDSMLRADTTARRLLGEYFTPMVNQGLSSKDAVALYEYLLSVGESPQAAASAN